MTCKDCLHFDVCYIVKHHGADTNENWAEYDCKQFKDRSRYVVREKGELVNAVCPACEFDLRCLTDGENDLEQWVWDDGFDFCPNCGADMRKGENG